MTSLERHVRAIIHGLSDRPDLSHEEFLLLNAAREYLAIEGGDGDGDGGEA